VIRILHEQQVVDVEGDEEIVAPMCGDLAVVDDFDPDDLFVAADLAWTFPLTISSQ